MTQQQSPSTAGYISGYLLLPVRTRAEAALEIRADHARHILAEWNARVYTKFRMAYDNAEIRIGYGLHEERRQ
jgi:hypothetical protein